MDRVIYSISAFVAVFCSVVVGSVMLSLAGLYEVDAIVAYGLAGLLGVAAARSIHRRQRRRAWAHSRT